MTEIPIPLREQQALREVGRTDVSRPVAAGLVAVLLAAVFGASALQLACEARGCLGLGQERGPLEALREPFAPFRELSRARLGETFAAGGLLAANRELLRAMNRFEDSLEEASFLRERLLPVAQALLTRALGLGNEQVYLGRDGWLFFRDDVDYAAGPPFLDPAVLRRRSRGGKAIEAAPQPDPVPALLDFGRQLGERGIDLVVFPTPVKPTIHPERLSARYPAEGTPVQNPSFEALVQRLRAGGVLVFDAAPLLAERRAGEGVAQYLATDTHWTPGAMTTVARALARFLETEIGLSPPEPGRYLERTVLVRRGGDIAAMLRLPERFRDLYPPEEVRAGRVLTREARAWQAERSAEVLLLGDSFTNIYSDPSLGWGTGAGFAEQLALALQRPVDRIALNAGGAYVARHALVRELAAGSDRLAGKRAVVYQFAARELSLGDWRLLDLADGGEGPAGARR